VIGLSEPLESLGVRSESQLKSASIGFIRQAWSGGHVYFVRNQSAKPIDRDIQLSSDWRWVVLMDPLTGRIGVPRLRFTMFNDGAQTRQLRLQLAPGETVFIKTFREKPADGGPGWVPAEPIETIPVTGEWSVEFMEGGPEPPAPVKFTANLVNDEAVGGAIPPPQGAGQVKPFESWTKFAGEAGERFAGTARYSVTFRAPGEGRYRLNLGKVADSARVVVNGKAVATLITAPFVTDVELQAGEIRLSIEVTNVAANRIRDMDRRRVTWKIFNDINIVDINYRPLDASRWPIREAGLLGPVTIEPLKVTESDEKQ
jgi:hypothetical protein